MSTLFTKIVNKEIPAYIVAEDENYLAFLDVFPLKKGHTLVIPKREEDNLFDLADDELANMMVSSQRGYQPNQKQKSNDDDPTEEL